MKKYFFLILTIALLVGCTNEKSPEVIGLEHLRDSLEAVNDQRDESINEFIKSMNEIEENLKEIKEKENIITLSVANESELGQDQKYRINDDILVIYELMQKNKDRISQLEKQLRGSNFKISELNKMIENLNAQLEERNIEIGQMRERLAELDMEIEVLSLDNDSLRLANARKDDVIDNQEDVINDKTAEMNTAWYVFGSKKELLEQNVITKEGGFVGIGRILKLMEDFNKDYFTKIDITQFDEISLNYKKVKVVTTHPSSAYHLQGEDPVEKLVITDPKEFWSASKYLVILVE